MDRKLYTKTVIITRCAQCDEFEPGITGTSDEKNRCFRTFDDEIDEYKVIPSNGKLLPSWCPLPSAREQTVDISDKPKTPRPPTIEHPIIMGKI